MQSSLNPEPRTSIRALLPVVAGVIVLGVTFLWIFRPAFTSRATRDTPIDLAEVVRVWNEVAAAKGVSPEAAAVVAGAVEEILGDQRVAIPAEQGAALERSLAGMIDAQRLSLNNAGDARGTGLLLSFCLAEAMSRAESPQTVDPGELRENQEKLVDLVVDRIERGLMEGAAKDQRPKMERQVMEGAIRLRATLKGRIAEMREDLLFPAFKTPFTDRQAEIILEKFENPVRYDPGRLDSVFENTPGSFMYSATMAQIEFWLLEQSEARNKLPGIGNTGVSWPIYVTFYERRPRRQAATRQGNEG